MDMVPDICPLRVNTCPKLTLPPHELQRDERGQSGPKSFHQGATGQFFMLRGGAGQREKKWDWGGAGWGRE